MGALLYVPTHRLVTESLSQRMVEIQSGRAGEFGDVVFCLIEHNLKAEVSKAHRNGLTRAIEEAGVDRVLHLTEHAARSVVEQLTDGDDSVTRALLRDRLLPDGSVNYGRGPNLAYLVAAAIGCDSVHRRDSDVWVPDVDRPPIELELECIGRQTAELAQPIRWIDRAPTQGRVVVVGTGTFGDPTFDRRHLENAGLEFLIDFQQLGRPGVDRSKVRDEAVSYLVVEPATNYRRDFLELDLDGRVEMESCAIWRLFLELPEMPSDILGCDYFVRDLALQTRSPIIFHSRKSEHVHDAVRAAQPVEVGYAIRDVQYIQLGRAWSRLGAAIRADVGRFFTDGTLNSDEYASTFQAAGRDAISEMSAVRIGAEEIFRRAASRAPSADRVQLELVADRLRASGSAVELHVVNEIDRYADLVQRWHHLVSRARDIGPGLLANCWVEG